MTNPDYTHLALVIDRSGSMQSIHEDMNGGIKELLAKQAQEPGILKVDVATFDNTVEFIYTDAEPAAIRDGLVEPRGSTALNDAIGQMITRLGNKFRTMREDDRPGTVIVVVVTDGMENASREYSTEGIKRMVTEQTDKWGWTFVYLAANVDAFATGSAYGFSPSFSGGYHASGEHVVAMASNLSANVSRVRKGDNSGWTQSEREAMEE